MKREFPAFYRPAIDEFGDLWTRGTFVPDANVLLNLYRYSDEAARELINTLEILSKSDHLWIPHQVALEYNKNRLNVIVKEKSKLKPISGIIDHHMNALKSELKKDDRTRKNTYAALLVTALEKKIDICFQDIKGELKIHLDRQPDLLENDTIRDKLSDIFDKKIGAPYDQTKLEEIYEETDRRYGLRIPPGYEDADNPTKKGRAKYGDVILWFQIIDYAKEKKLPIIFITDDDKEDWWNPYSEDNKDKQPNYELIQEFASETECSFYMYSPDRFLFWAKRQINAKVSDDTIEEIKQVQEDTNIKKENGWLIIGDVPGNPYSLKDAEFAHLRVYKMGDGFYAEVHANGSYERIRPNYNEKWEKIYFYHEIGEEGGFLGGESDPIGVVDEEIHSIDEMRSFLERYVSTWDTNTLKERAKDYTKQRPQWIKDQMKKG